MKNLLTVLLVALGLVPAMVTFAILVGLGMHRQAPAWAISTSATLLVFGPPIVASSLARRQRARVFAGLTALWSATVFLVLPVYFPKERHQALVTGLSLNSMGGPLEGMARAVADSMPDEPEMAVPEVPEATTLATTLVPEPLDLADNQIALPYEGQGRRMSVPVAFEHDGTTPDTIWMMLDTGATYTTLPTDVLAELGIHPGPDDPEITLHTANGERTARVVLLDKVWLGDLALEGVAIATCDGCSSSDTAGLLGLNVTGGFNLNIDADRQEVVFTTRKSHDRHLDIKPFTDVDAEVQRFPGGRVEVRVVMENEGRRHIRDAGAAIHCDGASWLVELGEIPVGESRLERRRLPPHDPCETYQVGLAHASW